MSTRHQVVFVFAHPAGRGSRCSPRSDRAGRCSTRRTRWSPGPSLHLPEQHWRLPQERGVLLLALLAGAEVGSTAPDRGAPTLRSLKHALPAPRRAAAQPDCISGGPFLIESDRRFANERRAGDVHAVRFHVRRHVPGVVPTHLCLLACWPTRGHLYHTILAVAWKMG